MRQTVPIPQRERERALVDPDTTDEDTESPNLLPDETLDEFLTAMHRAEPMETGSDGKPTLGWLKTNFKTKSGIIRFLKHQGYTPKEISDITGFRYQHCYNVVNQELKRGPNEQYTPSDKWACSHTKSTQIVDVIVRHGARDPNGTRILYRVCADCAVELIPGVTKESLKDALPALNKDTDTTKEVSVT